MSQTLSMRFCRVFFMVAVSAIVGSLSCLKCCAAEPESGTSNKQRPADSEKRKSLDSAKDPKLRQELLARTAEDQDARKQWIRLMGSPEQSEDVKKQIHFAVAKMLDVDRKNLTWMKETVKRSGWPGKTLVGSDGRKRRGCWFSTPIPTLRFRSVASH